MANFLKLNKSYLGPEVLSNGSFDEYGPELVTNGDFLNGINNWTASDSTIIVENGVLEIISAGGNRPQANQTVSGLVVGSQYKLSAVAKRGTTANDVEIEISGIASLTTSNRNSTTEYETIFYTFIATATSHTIQAKIDNGSEPSETTAYFSNVSLKESGAVELVDNGRFASIADGTDVTSVSSQWTYSSFSSSDIESNILECIASGANQFAWLEVSTVVGAEYRLKVDSVTGDLADNSVRVGSKEVDVTSGSGELVFTATSSTTIIQFYAGDGYDAAQTNYTGISLQSTNQFAYDFERDGDTGQYAIFDLQSKTVRLVAFKLNTKVKVKASLPQATTVNQEYLIKIDVAEVVGSAPFIFFNGIAYTEINLEVGENEFIYKRAGSGNSIIFGIQAVNSSQIGSSITLNSISLQEVVNQPKLIGVDNVSMVSAPTDNTVVINNGLTDGADTLTITYAGASASSRVQMRNFFQDSIVRLANSNNTAEVLEITPPVLITDIVAS